MIAVVRGTLLAAALIGAATAAVPAADKRTQGWFLGVPVVFDVWIPAGSGGRGPAAPPAGPVAPVYLIAPTDAAVAFTPDLMIDTPAGRKLLPAHQDVLATCADAPDGLDTDGFFVVAGPRADDATVRVRAIDQQAASVPGAALASAIRIGPAWVPLTSHVVIDQGVASGRLRLVKFMYGGRVRASGFDGSVGGCRSGSGK